MRKIEIQTLLDFRFVSNPLFSPDGKWIAFAVSLADAEENTYKANLYLYDMRKKEVKQLTNGGDAKAYSWTEDNTLVFIANRETAAKQEKKTSTYFYEISPWGGEASMCFSLSEKAVAVSLLPNGRFLLTIRHDNYADSRKTTYEVIDELPFLNDDFGFTNAVRDRYAVFDRKSGELTYLADEWTECIQFSVLGNQLLYKAYPWKQSVRGLNPGIYLYNLNTGETKTLLEPEAMRTEAMELISENEAIVAAADNKYIDTNKYCDFYKLNLISGEMSFFLPYDTSIGVGSVGTDARYGKLRGTKAHNGEFYYVSTIGEYAHLIKLDANGVFSEYLTDGCSCDSFDVNEDHLVSCEFKEQKLTELYLDGEQITHFNDVFHEEYSVVKPEPLTFTASDGFDIHGWVMKPAGYCPGTSYPAILHIHGGPRTVFTDMFHHEMQTWANAGYFVFYCNPRGSDGRGTEFGNIKGIYGTVDYQNVMEFIDEVLKNYPDIDTTRMGVTGGSYGGFMTSCIVSRSNRFAAAVSQRAPVNWTLMEHTTDIGHTFVPNNLGTVTSENSALLWEQSTLRELSKCRTPILFIHSDQDYRCNLAEGISAFSAVKRSGCPTKLCVFHGENHHLSKTGSPKGRLDRMTEILGWFDAYLK